MIFNKEQIIKLKKEINIEDFYSYILGKEITYNSNPNMFHICCPFHEDKNPSFTIMRDSGFWRCWSEGIYGDIIDFYSRFFGKTFPQSVLEIAKQFNIDIELSEEMKYQLKFTEAVHSLNKKVSKFYTNNLIQDLDAKKYLKSRNLLDSKTVGKWGIGYTGNYKLNSIFPKFSKLLFMSNLTYENGNNYFSDKRISIPFHDDYGNIIGFTTRAINSDMKPKYLHSKSSDIFNKSEVLFGYCFAKDIIKKYKNIIIVEGQCFKEDAEILTPKGWIKFKNYNGEKVMQVNKDLTGEFVEPKNIIIKDYNGNINSINNKNYSIEATEDHNIVYIDESNNKKELKKRQFKDMPKSLQGRIPMAINHSGEGLNLSDDEIRLLIAISADGSLSYRKDSSIYIRASFKKQRKIERFEALLNSCNIKYYKSNQKSRPDMTFFGFKFEKAFKIFPDNWISDSTLEQKKLIISELIHWDACKIKDRNQTEFCSAIYKNAIFIQTLSHLSGCNSSIYKKEDKLGLRYRVNILHAKNSASWQQGYNSEKYQGKVYCVSVDSGMILIRVNGKISVVGNCDVIRAHQHGIENCVGICGNALTDEHVNKIKNHVKTYYLVVEDDKFDKDRLDKTYETIIKNNYWAEVKIVKLYDKDKCDLDDYLETYGKQAFLELVSNSPTYYAYKLRDLISNINYKTIEDKKKQIYKCRKYLKELPLLERKQYIQTIANTLELPVNDIYNIINREEEKSVVVGKYDDRITLSQKMIIASLFSKFSRTREGLAETHWLIQKLGIEEYLDDKFKIIYEKIIDIYLQNTYNCDIINSISSEDIEKELLDIIVDCYFKNDEFEGLDDYKELELFLLDMLENLK